MPRKKQPKAAVTASAEVSVKAEDGEGQPSEQGTNNEGASTESLASPTTATTSTTRTKKRKRKNYDEAEDDSFVLPHERKTEAGGYAHTNLSKSKISKANTGNTPWNKGRNRSSADRAKIASGVRARNRAQLLKKLKKLGLSEDEWNQKKKEIKYLRERIRRAKATNSKHKAALAEKQLAEMLKATGKKGLKDYENETNPDATKSNESDDGEADEEKKEEDPQQPSENALNPEIIFARDVEFKPHPFGGSPIESQSYNQACPTGGPGGLICCDECCTAYSQYLTQTAKDIELQRTEKAGKEVNEILEFLEEGRATLDRAAKVARKIIPPLPLRPPEPEPLSKRAAASESGGGGRKGMNASRLEQEQYNASMSWNLTSAIDIGSSGYVQI